jgi:hypothetical protein
MQQPETGPTRSTRRDGWTPARQLRFLDALARTRSVTRAAVAAGMSRESAYRLRNRDPDGLFAAAWNRLLQRPALSRSKGHRRGKVSAWRQAVKDAGFAAFSTKGHEVDEPPFSPLHPVFRDPRRTHSPPVENVWRDRRGSR